MIDTAIVVALFAFILGIHAGFIILKIPIVVGGIAATFTRAHRPPKRALFLFGAYVISAAFSSSHEFSWTGRSDAWTMGVMSAAVYCALTAYTSDRPWLRYAGVLLSCHAVAQRANLDPFIPTSMLPAGQRAVASIGSPIDLGAILAMAATVSGPWLPVIIVGLWATGTRGAWISAAFAMTPKRFRALWIIPALVLLARPLANKDIARLEVWKVAVRSFIENPILGSGPDTFIITFTRMKTPAFVKAMGGPTPTQAEAHNDLLQMLATTGLVGLFAYLFFCWPLLDCTPLLALFVFMKFNPVSFEVLCCAALLAGTHLRKKA